MKTISIAGVGCCLLDRIYDRSDFRSAAFLALQSRRPGDGGLEPGKLTFEEELERFAGRPFPAILPTLTGGLLPDAENIGGPCIVALIGAAQIAGEDANVSFYGCYGTDLVGQSLLRRLAKMPRNLLLDHFLPLEGQETASTTVLSDPAYDGGHGERTFINVIGASWHYGPQDVAASFYEADLCVFGGTAIVPEIHRSLRQMLARARQHGSLTIVNTVYDSLSEKQHPGRRWLLGDSDETYALIDLLILDREEALRLSGTDSIPAAIAFFRSQGTGAVMVTSGAADVSLWADSPRFQKAAMQTMPVSSFVGEELRRGRKGDSTGCGDNFAGGIIGSLARQMHNGASRPDLVEACRWGIVAGGFACFYYGGTYLESEEGEKRRELQKLYDLYLSQSVPNPRT